MIISGIASGLKDLTEAAAGKVAITGRVVIVKKEFVDFTDLTAMLGDPLSGGVDTVGRLLNPVSEVIGGMSFQLISATVADRFKSDKRGVVSEKTRAQENLLTAAVTILPGEYEYKVKIWWKKEDGIPGAIAVTNNQTQEFFLKSITLEDVPNKGRIFFDCSSWVYPATRYRYERYFFSNETYVTGKIPPALQYYVDQELLVKRGDNERGPFQEWDRVYSHDIYNDLGENRAILGGKPEMPYPRRGRTSRAPSRTNPAYESRLFAATARLDIYVPRDERFGHAKLSDFLAYLIKGLTSALIPALETYLNSTPGEFDSFEDVFRLYDGSFKLPNFPVIDAFNDLIVPFELGKELLRSDGNQIFRFPLPAVVQADREAWRQDSEFAREMLAGVHPLHIQLLREFPPKSKLDPAKYGKHDSTLTAADLGKAGLLPPGLTVDAALQQNRLFILDHHDDPMPYIRRINTDTGSKVYASRTILFLRDDSTLIPLAIELSLPSPQGDQFGSVSKVFTPSPTRGSVEDSIWQLAKAYVAVLDNGFHQLISHWLKTHAVIEPFILGTHRQLSAVHPIFKILTPHFRDTMTINALARNTLVCADGAMERTVYPSKYALEYSSLIYKDWNFVEQSLPNDLIKRGIAVEDSSQPHGLRLLIPDYPYAVDGLDIYGAINTWVTEYVSIYYPDDASVKADTQIQAWWKDCVEKGHADLKDKSWWPKMSTRADLIFSCTTIMWTSSALHAAVNFGQYPYGGFVPNRPSVSRRFVPEPGTPEYAELEKNPDKVYLLTITSQFLTILGVTLVEVLSRHASDEVYLGQRPTVEWTNDQKAIDAFNRFGKNLVEIEQKIVARNNDPSLKNRTGPAQIAYMLQYPSTSDPKGAAGISGKGIPNSISI